MQVAIIGGGIAGLSAAIALRDLEADIDIFESAPAFGAVGAGLVLAANAVRALHVLGIEDEVLSKGNEIKEMKILDRDGRIISRTDNLAVRSRYGVLANFSIHRADLHEVLLSQIGAARLHAGKRCRDFRLTTGGVTLEFEDGSTQRADYVLVADGVHSIFRQRLLPGSVPRYAGYTCWRAIVDGYGGIPADRASETWGPGRRFGIVPLTGDRIYWFATLNAPRAGDPAYAAYALTDLQRTFAGFHAPVPALLERTPPERLLWNDIIDVSPVRRYAFDRILLLGDAAHATTPNMGQGACQALEDSATLRALLQAGESLPQCFGLLESRRQARAAWVTNTSYRLGKLAQWENPLLISLRNALLRRIPDSVNRRQLDKLFNVTFER